MNRRHIALSVVLMLVVLLCPCDSRSALSQGKSGIISGWRLPISSNEALALLTLRHLVEAEYTFESTIGRGRDFGSLQELAAAQLIDPELARVVLGRGAAPRTRPAKGAARALAPRSPRPPPTGPRRPA